MKRSIFNTVKIILFIVGFFFALYYFLQWQELGKFSMSFAHSQLEKRGMRLNYSDVSGEKDGFTVNNLRLNGIANISFSSITIKPKFLSSILSLAPVCEINFRGGSLQLGQVMNFGDGGFLLTAGRNEILLEDLKTNGDFAINGFLTINPATMRIGRTEARLNFPEDFEKNIQAVRNFLPIVQEGGRWYLRRK